MVNFKLSCLFVITVVMNRLHERNVNMPCSRYAAGKRLRERGGEGRERESGVCVCVCVCV